MSWLLETFKYAKFIKADENVNSTERKNGVPRFGGEPPRFGEYAWRVRAKVAKEEMIDESERKKLGPLGLRLVEGLSPAALRVAQEMETKELSSPTGPDNENLLAKLQSALKPKRTQEARELYQAGAREGGMLSRQQGEPMATYIACRRAWYQAMTGLDDQLKLPELILAKQVLVNSGISENHQLLVRSALAGVVTVGKVCDELVAQHGHVHEREQRHGGKGKHRGFFDRNPQSYTGFVAEEHYDGAWEADDVFEEQNAFHVEYDNSEYEAPAYDNSQTHDDAEFDEGEIFANLASQGLDVDDEEALEYAAEIIQTEQEAFFARQKACKKGFKGSKNKGSGRLWAFPPSRHFDVQGQLSLSKGRQRVQSLKSRTTCRKCGHVGHWSGDFMCPKNAKGGKSGPGSVASSSAPTKYSARAARGHRDGKPRTVYFGIKSDDGNSRKSYMAMRYNAVPPPSCLGPSDHATGSSPGEWSVISSEQHLTQDDLDNAMLVSALGVPEI